MSLTKVIGDGTGTIDNLTVADGGTIGSASKTNAITIASSGLVQLTSTGIGAGSQVFQVIDDGATVFQIRSEDGNVSFPQAGAGIFLGVTAGNSANLLDDYEEGTWTPATSSSSYNTSSSTGLYTKIGRIVIAHFSINFSGVNSSSNSIVNITNFPFTNGGAIASAGTVRESSNTGAVYTTRIGTNTTTATMNSMDNVTNGSQRTIRTGEDYVGTLIYVT